MSEEEPTREDLSAACSDLVRLWHSRPEINPDRSLPGYHEARLHSVSALAAHAYRTGEIADDLIGRGLGLESAPLIRTAYECAVTAVWAAQVPDGVQAILNEDYRSRRLMAHAMARSEAWKGSGLDVPTPTDEDHDSLSTAQARNFLQMCDDLTPGGADAYAYYRTLCWFTHPTNYVMDHYTELVEVAGDPLLKLRRVPTDIEDTTYLFQFFCAVALVLAASAVNFLDVEKSHQRRIRALARRVGVTPEMQLTAKARARLFGQEDA